MRLTDAHHRYRMWALDRYVKYGKPTRESDRMKIALAPLLEACPAGLQLQDLAPAHLEGAQQLMVLRGWKRGYCNTCLGCIKRFLSYCYREGWIDFDQLRRLRMVDGLARGRTTAPESAPVGCVPAEVVLATLPHIAPIPRDMVRVQLLTGMRGGEVCVMRACDLDTTRTPWLYVPHRHKEEHQDLPRSVFLGPQARAVLQPYLDRRPPDGYLFSPIEACAENFRRLRGFPEGLSGGRGPNLAYSAHSYKMAVYRGCRRAGVPRWSPLQLRHSKATESRAQFGPDATRALLGHTTLQHTAVYAELDLAKAALIAEQTG